MCIEVCMFASPYIFVHMFTSTCIFPWSVRYSRLVDSLQVSSISVMTHSAGTAGWSPAGMDAFQLHRKAWIPGVLAQQFRTAALLAGLRHPCGPRLRPPYGFRKYQQWGVQCRCWSFSILQKARFGKIAKHVCRCQILNKPWKIKIQKKCMFMYILWHLFLIHSTGFTHLL